MHRKSFTDFIKSDEWLYSIIENMFDGIYITDGNANTVAANHSYETITGLKREDLIGKNMKDLVSAGIISQSGSLQAIESQQPVTLQQTFRTGRHALITSTPIYGTGNQIQMVVTNVRDMTEIHNLRQEVQRQNEEQELLRTELLHIRQKVGAHKNIIAKDTSTLSALFLADRVAPMDSTVTLLGETGVGKEVFAEYIYRNSKRSQGPFIRINCGAIPPNLIESELFGYEKGSFTGANKNGKPGLFEIANHGTIFLDEIGELPLDMQVKPLRVIQEKEIKRIGGSKAIPVDVRIIAATNRDLAEMVRQKTFREDLYYRIMVFPLNLPPLRERKKDIIPLANLFLEQLNQKYDFQKYFSDQAIFLMQRYECPGNLRELRNIVERAVIITSGDEIPPENMFIIPADKFQGAAAAKTDDLHCQKGLTDEQPLPNHDCSSDRDSTHTPHNGHDKAALPLGEVSDLKKALECLEAQYIEHACQTCHSLRKAAASLGMNHTTLLRKRQKYLGATHET